MEGQRQEICALKEMFPEMMPEIIEEAVRQNPRDALDTLLAIQASEHEAAPTLQKLMEREREKANGKSLSARVALMVDDAASLEAAQKRGLNIEYVSFEDPGRSRWSTHGPLISDLTLVTDEGEESRMMPLVRFPRFQDMTWDIRIEDVLLPVGNARGRAQLVPVNLRDYLRDFSDYLTNKPSGRRIDLLAERDTHVIATAQACFLPVEAGGSVNFTVCLKNWQSRPGLPAVLAIVASSEGTSAQVITSQAGEFDGQRLYHNANGHCASFVAKRLADDRKARGAQHEGDMDLEEEQRNFLMVIQVPLLMQQKMPVSGWRHNSEPRKQWNKGHREPPSYASAAAGALRRVEEDVEDAMLHVGAEKGPFSELDGLSGLVRDARYPVRLTVQLFKCTSTGEASDAVFERIAHQLSEQVNRADFLGSLVVEPPSGRPTEHE